MICPECRGAKHQANHLHDVSHDGYCPSCNINFEVDFARTVEGNIPGQPGHQEDHAPGILHGQPA